MFNKGSAMKKYLMFLAVLVVLTGCDNQQKDADARRDALKEIELAEAGDKRNRVEEAKTDDEATDNRNDGRTDPAEEVGTDTKLVARTVLDDAVAAAKSENKALFVHFTADW